MRAVFATLLFAAACTPDVAPGTYLCGPEELCPDGLACNRATAICEVPSNAEPFACGDKNVDVPGDDAPATAQSLGDFACVSLVAERRSCMPVGDAGDFYRFRVNDGCTNVHVTASVVHAVAFERLVLQLAKEGETPVTIDTPCSSNRTTDDGNAVSCLDAPVGPGTYVIGVVPDGTGNCDNECRFNRYGLAVQVTNQ
jgi:hypothetical protein